MFGVEDEDEGEDMATNSEYLRLSEKRREKRPEKKARKLMLVVDDEKKKETSSTSAAAAVEEQDGSSSQAMPELEDYSGDKESPVDEGFLETVNRSLLLRSQEGQLEPMSQMMADIFALADEEDTETETPNGGASLASSCSESSVSELEDLAKETKLEDLKEDFCWTAGVLESKVERKTMELKKKAEDLGETELLKEKAEEFYAQLKARAKKELEDKKKAKKSLFNWLMRDSYDYMPQHLFTKVEHSVRRLFKGWRVVVENVVNEELARRFVHQWVLFRAQYGETSPEAQPVMAFHGTAMQNLKPIKKKGFLIGGVDTKKANGDYFGIGVYLGASPWVSRTYARGKRMLVCAALPGKVIASKQGHSAVSFHADSFRASGIMIMARPSQVLPLYIVYYGGTTMRAPQNAGKTIA